MDPQAQQSQNSQAPINTMPTQHKKVGPIIAILVIVLVLIIGALYLFASRINQQQTPVDNTVADTNTNTPVAPVVVEPQTVQPVVNKADDVNALQADLNSATNGLGNQSF